MQQEATKSMKTVMKKSKEIKKGFPDVPIHGHMYYKWIPYKQDTEATLIVDPNPYLRTLEFYVELYTITLQSLPKPLYGKNQILRLADVYIQRKKDWELLKVWKLKFKDGLSKPMPVKVVWKSMSEFADVNPPYIKPTTRMILWVEETKLTGEPLGLPTRPYYQKCSCGFVNTGRPLKKCPNCGREWN